MKIVFTLIALTILFSVMGWGICRSCVRQAILLPAGLFPALGYSAAIVLFFPLYFVFEDAYVTSYVVVAAGLLLFLWGVWKSRKSLPSQLNESRQLWSPYLLFFMVILVAAIPYLQYGSGHYWHTGNEDIVDALNGRNAFLQKQLQANGAGIDVSTRVGSRLRTLISEQILKKKITPEYIRERYVHDLGRLQYSSLAFLSAILNMPKGMDAFVIQALLNLGFFALGVYTFAFRIFNIDRHLALISAGLASLSNFYFTTFVNGHEGSLMYNSVIPFVMCFGVVAVRDRIPLGNWMIIPAILLIMAALAYPYPLMYAVVPIVIYVFLEWWGRSHGGKSVTEVLLARKTQVLLLVLALAAFFVAYLFAEPMRIKALSQYRSWGTAINHIGFLQFWGIWPSSVALSITDISWLDASKPLKIASLIFAAVLTLLSIYGLYRLIKQGVSFLAVWGPCWLFFFLVMRFAVEDSYYVYKFLYINAWLIISILIVSVVTLIRDNRLSLRILGGVVAIGWLGLNATHNVAALQGINSNEFNSRFSSFQAALDAPKDKLSETFIDIPLDAHASIVRLIIGEGGYAVKRNKAEAKYILQEKGVEDIIPLESGPIVWESERFILIEKPENDLMELASYWQPEKVGNGQIFRWVSDIRIGKILIDIENRSPAKKFLYLCGESGPSIDYQKFKLSVLDVNKKMVGTIPIGTYACHSLDITGFSPPFSIDHQEKGRVVSYIDNRKLVYRIMKLGFSTSPVEFTPSQPLSPEDITSAGQILLGQNWYPFEVYQGEKFRWVKNEAEFLLTRSKNAGTLQIEAEPGPSAGGPVTLWIESQAGERLGECHFEGRKVCEIQLALNQNEPSLLKLMSDAKGQPIANDPRILNFRLFSMQWKS